MAKDGKTSQCPYTIEAEQYVEMLKSIIKGIENRKPKDRLGYALATSFMLNGAIMSIKGWQQWINSLERLNVLTLADFKENYPKMRDALLDFMRSDIEITEKKIKDVQAQFKKSKKQIQTLKKRYIT